MSKTFLLAVLFVLAAALLSGCVLKQELLQPQGTQKKLEEMNLTQDDFPGNFFLDESMLNYTKNLLEYADQNAEWAGELKKHGWLENYAVSFERFSEFDNEEGENPLFEGYIVSMSRYDAGGDFASFFKNSVERFRKSLEAEEGVEILAQGFGDNSVFAKYTETDEAGTATEHYIIYFSKSNVFVNFFAYGLPGEITEGKAAEYARKIEGRIR